MLDQNASEGGVCGGEGRGRRVCEKGGEERKECNGNPASLGPWEDVLTWIEGGRACSCVD